MNKKILMLENQKNYLRIIRETTNKLLDNVELLHAKNTSEGIVIAMEALINDQNLCSSLGETGRKHVIEKYEWNYCVDKMISIYDKYRYKA